MLFVVGGRSHGRRHSLHPIGCTPALSVMYSPAAAAVAACGAVQVLCRDNDYTMSRIRAGLETLESRRDQLTERFFPAQCPAGVVMSSLSAPGQARSLCHRQTATSKKL